MVVNAGNTWSVCTRDRSLELVRGLDEYDKREELIGPGPGSLNMSWYV